MSILVPVLLKPRELERWDWDPEICVSAAGPCDMHPPSPPYTDPSGNTGKQLHHQPAMMCQLLPFLFAYVPCVLVLDVCMCVYVYMCACVCVYVFDIYNG